jgi:hypothetical protein
MGRGDRTRGVGEYEHSLETVGLKLSEKSGRIAGGPLDPVSAHKELAAAGKNGVDQSLTMGTCPQTRHEAPASGWGRSMAS